MEIVLYGFWTQLVERQLIARVLAQEIVLKTAHTMYLENQGLDESAIKAAIDKRTEKIKNEMPKNLWN